MTRLSDAEIEEIADEIEEDGRLDIEGFRVLHQAIRQLQADLAAMTAERDVLRERKDEAYEERNRLVALLASLFPSGTKRTDIPGWDHEWHGCVYIDFPWGQASWHYHDRQAHLFAHLPSYGGAWDGHTTEAKYDAIARAATNKETAT